jgi:hypothetical protein
MKSILIGSGAIVGLLMAVALVTSVIGTMLPVKHQVSRSETFTLPAAQLWDLSLAIFHRTNDGTYAVVEAEAPRRLVTAVVAKNLPYEGTWTYDFAPHGDATTLTITEQGEVTNPFFRFMSRFVFGYEGSIRTYFATLRAAAIAAGAKNS